MLVRWDVELHQSSTNVVGVSLVVHHRNDELFVYLGLKHKTSLKFVQFFFEEFH